MMISSYRSISLSLKVHAERGKPRDVDIIMHWLNDADLPITRIVDFRLSLVADPEGIERIAHYLFHGTQIQKNYAALFFSRRNEWCLVNKAYAEGCIDRIQAFSR